MKGSSKGFVLGVVVGVVACHVYMNSTAAKGNQDPTQVPFIVLPTAAFIGLASLLAQVSGVDAGGGPWSAINTLLLVVLAVSQQRLKRKVEVTDEDISEIADLVILKLETRGAFGRRRHTKGGK